MVLLIRHNQNEITFLDRMFQAADQDGPLPFDNIVLLLEGMLVVRRMCSRLDRKNTEREFGGAMISGDGHEFDITRKWPLRQPVGAAKSRRDCHQGLSGYLCLSLLHLEGMDHPLDIARQCPEADGKPHPTAASYPQMPKPVPSFQF